MNLCPRCNGLKNRPGQVDDTSGFPFKRTCPHSFHNEPIPVIVGCGGCFDILHVGHIRLLQTAAAMGDGLIVYLNSDASVQRLKGSGHPINPENHRAEMLMALSCVTAVRIFSESDPSYALNGGVAVNIWVKGEDYKDKPLPEAGTVIARGGKIVFVPFSVDTSTTKLLGQVVRNELAKLKREL